MLTNVVIILFLLAMVYFWGVWGVFSAFLHLIITIVAAALALAMWEPLVFQFGFPMKPEYAWCVWLVGPFVLLVIVLRVLVDKIVPKNMDFNPLVNYIIGGFLGLQAGIISAGIAVIGIGFLPLPADFAGYRPLGVDDATGEVSMDPDSTLWVPVDRITSDYMELLSYGVFHAGGGNGARLDLTQPKLYEQAALIRLRYTPHHAAVITPGAVDVGSVFDCSTPVPNLLPELAAELGASKVTGAEHRVVVVDLKFQRDPKSGAYDVDSTLRVSPSQVRLVTWRVLGSDTLAVLNAPRGYSKHNEFTNRREFEAFKNSSRYAFSVLSEETQGWTFVIPKGDVPKYILVRHLRLELPDKTNDNANDLRTAIGDPVGTSVLAEHPETPTPGTATAPAPGTSPGSEPTSTAPADPNAVVEGTIGGRTGKQAGSVAIDIEVNPNLPMPISANIASMLENRNGGVDAGTGDVKPSNIMLTENTRISRINVPSHQALVRVRLARDQAQSLLGAARVAAARLGTIFIEDSSGEKYMPHAYVWVQRPDNVQQISVEPLKPIQSGAQLPITKMGKDDELYLYFVVRRNVKITSYNLGQMQQFVTLDIPPQQ